MGDWFYEGRKVVRDILYAVQESSSYGKGNREYASDVFSMLMQDGAYRLDVYNALNNSDYTDPKLVEVIQLEEGISLSVRNDASFLIDGRANFYEHQSTYSPNMPLRFLIYFSQFLRSWIAEAGEDILSRRLVKIPTPHFVVFYNGTEKRPEVEELRLSAAFMQPPQEGVEPELEVRCVIYNINPGMNSSLKDKSEVLWGYMHFVNKVRTKIKQGEPLSDAVDKAIKECIEENVLKRFFKERKSEVKKMIEWDLTMETHMERMRKEEREEGRAEGRAEERLNTLREAARAEKAERELKRAMELLKKNGLVLN